jgi:hypothetical protein
MTVPGAVCVRSDPAQTLIVKPATPVRLGPLPHPFASGPVELELAQIDPDRRFSPCPTQW